MKKSYVLDSDLRILYNGQNQIRLKMGMWNYNEATLDMASFSNDLRIKFKNILCKMNDNSGFDIEELYGMELNREEKSNLESILLQLEDAGMIYDKQEKDIKEKVNDVLLGNLKASFDESDRVSRKVLFVSDSEYSICSAKTMCEYVNIELDFKGLEFINNIASMDAVTNLDALTTEKSIDKIKEEIKEYHSVVISLKHVNMNFLRNLNRASIELKKPVVVGMIDGPFVTILSVNPPKTGCIECFEKRILARLEDHVLYEKYVKNDFTSNTKLNPSKIILSNLITNLVLGEAFLLKNLGSTKFEGRVLSVFIPSFEIQVQDLLRVPYCDGCGNVSKAKFEELNVNSRVIIDDILKTIREK